MGVWGCDLTQTGRLRRGRNRTKEDETGRPATFLVRIETHKRPFSRAFFDGPRCTPTPPIILFAKSAFGAVNPPRQEQER